MSVIDAKDKFQAKRQYDYLINVMKEQVRNEKMRRQAEAFFARWYDTRPPKKR